MRSKLFWLGILFGAVLTVVFWSSLVFHINQPLGFAHGDAYRDYFVLKHYVHIAQTGDWGNLATTPEFYGFKNSLFFNDHFLVLGALAILLQPFTKSVITSFHILSLITIFLSFAGMYTLVWYFTKKFYPSAIAGVIYAFNSFVTGRFSDHIEIYAMQWIPFIFLVFELWITKRKARWGFVLFLLLTAQLMASSLYLSVMLSVLLPVYACMRIWQTKTPLRFFPSKWAIIGSLLFIIVTGINIYFYSLPYRLHMTPRNMDQILLFSPYVSDYLFSTPNTVLYGGIKSVATQQFPAFVRTGIPSEHNVFWGIIPWILFIVSIFLLRRSKERNVWIALLITFVLAVLFSFGPWIHVSDTIGFPGPYALLYWADPVVRLLRVPARFVLFAIFSVAVIAGFTVEKFDNKRWGMWVSAAILVGILAEYWVKPLEFLPPQPNLASVYATVNSTAGVRVLLEWPVANDFPLYLSGGRPEDDDTGYLLWATIYHNKTLFDGYAGTYPLLYWQRTQFLSTNFPSVETLKLLKIWSVDAIVVHRDQYSTQVQYDSVLDGLQKLGVPQITGNADAASYNLKAWKEAR